MTDGYPPDALKYDARKQTWSLRAGFNVHGKMWRIEEGRSPLFVRLLDANGAVHDEGVLSIGAPIMVQTQGACAIRIDRLQINGVLALYVPSEAMQPDRPYADSLPATSTSTDLSAGSFCDHSFLGAGALIATIDGPQPIDWLRQGDMVLTRDNGYQPILHLIQADLSPNTPLARLPLCVPGETFGTRLPARKLTLTGGSQILLSAPQLELWFGETEMFATLAQIGPDLRARRSSARPTLWSILFADPEVILAEGLWIGSALASPDFLDLIHERPRAQVSSIVTPRHKYAARACLNDADMALFARKGKMDAHIAAA